MGVANASVAHAEGLSSLFYNPALQLEFNGFNLDLGLTLVSPEKELDSTRTGQSYESEHNICTPMHLSASYRLSERSSLALGVNNSFGLRSEFPEDTIFRYLTTSSELTTWDINPSLAMQLHERLAVAVGIRAVRSEATLEQMIPLQAFAQADGRQRFKGDATGYGWNIGATLNPVEQWTIGASYRSQVELDLDGDLHYDLPKTAPTMLSSLFPATSAAAELTLPAQFFVGIAYAPSPQWVVEAALRYEHYSSYERLSVTTALPVAGKRQTFIPKNWDDVWGYMLGGSYQNAAGYRFSLGYLYEENPVPDATFEPGTSGMDKQTLTVGIGKQLGRLSYRLSYAYDFYQDREIDNDGPAAVLNGSHSQDNHSLAMTLSWQL